MVDISASSVMELAYMELCEGSPKAYYCGEKRVMRGMRAEDLQWGTQRFR